MLSLPSPLHPAVVHFPIVLILLGTLVAVGAAFISRWHVRWIAAILLALGTLGTVVATNSGEEDGEAVERVAAISPLLEAHETWAERTLWMSAAAAALAIGTALTSRWLLANRALGAVCALSALVASYCVYETGHRGGQLVYRHGAGINLSSANATGSDSVAPAARVKSRHREDGGR